MTPDDDAVRVQKKNPPVREQAAIDRADIDLAVPRREAARRRATAGEPRPLCTDVRVIRPQLLARLAVVGRDDVVDADVVEHAVDDNRARLHTAHRLEIVVPGEAQLPDVAVVDLVERAEPLLVPGPAVAHPVADVRRRIGIAQRLPVDDGLCSRRRDAQRQRRRHGQRPTRCSPPHPLDHFTEPVLFARSR